MNICIYVYYSYYRRRQPATGPLRLSSPSQPLRLALPIIWDLIKPRLVEFKPGFEPQNVPDSKKVVEQKNTFRKKTCFFV